MENELFYKHSTINREGNVKSKGFCLSNIRCRINPSVILTMLDAHNRLQDDYEFAIGTLLGSVSTDIIGTKLQSSVTVINVVDCFINPHHWDSNNLSLSIQKDPLEWMLKLRDKINQKLNIVGWCCTTSQMLCTVALSDWVRSDPKISRFNVTKALPEPLILSIDASFSKQMSILNEIKAYIRGPLRQLFYEIPFEIVVQSNEMPTISRIIKNSQLNQNLVNPCNTSPSSLNESSLQDSVINLKYSLQHLKNAIKPCLQYVQDVLNGKPGDVNIGRTLMETLCFDPLLSREEIKELCETCLQDNLMIAYLINLAHLQFVVADKLNTSFT